MLGGGSEHKIILIDDQEIIYFNYLQLTFVRCNLQVTWNVWTMTICIIFYCSVGAMILIGHKAAKLLDDRDVGE